MKTLTLLLLLWTANSHAQSLITKNPDGTMTLRPARLCYEVSCQTSTSINGPWIETNHAWGPQGGTLPCAGFAFTTPAVNSGEPARYWRLVIVR